MEREYSDDELLEYLREITKELGRPPTATEVYEAEDYPSVTTYQRHFDSFLKAKKEAGLPLPESGVKQHSDEELLEFLRDFSIQIDGVVTWQQFQDAGDYPSAVTYENRFGSWNKAKREAGIELAKEGCETKD